MLRSEVRMGRHVIQNSSSEVAVIYLFFLQNADLPTDAAKSYKQGPLKALNLVKQNWPNVANFF